MLIEKALLIKNFYRNSELAFKTWREFRTVKKRKKKIKEGRGLGYKNVIVRRLMKQFEEIGNLKNLSRNGRPKLSPKSFE